MPRLIHLRFLSLLTAVLVVSASVALSLPAAPSGPVATAVSGSQINLSWIDNSTNGSNAENGFKIERASSSSGPWTLLATTVANVTSYANTGLNSSTTYWYHIYSFDSKDVSATTNPVSATTFATLPAAPGSLLAAAASAAQIDISWDDNSYNETGFKVERALASSGPWTQLATLAARSDYYSSTGLTASTTYYLRVRATNSAGDSAYSNTASATTLASTPTVPTAPTGLLASAASSSQINLSWADVSNETNYYVERATSSAGPYTQVGSTPVNITSYPSTPLAASTTYYFRVRAYNTAGYSLYSGIASATTQASCTATIPSALTNLSATGTSSSQINLTWTDNSSNESGFRIEQAASSSGPWNQRATTGANATSYSDTALAGGTTYYYRIRAYNCAGDSSNSNTSSATTLGTVPPPPTGLTATPYSSSQINVAWTDVTGETTYYIERATASAGPYTQIGTTSANVALYSSGGLTTSTTYYYRVRAYNAVGYSNYSTPASATPAGSAARGAHLWSTSFKSLNGSDSAYPKAVATDPAGNVFVVGNYQGTIDVSGRATLSNASSSNMDVYLAKFDADGTLQWARSYGGPDSEEPRDMDLDGSGNVIVVGYTQGISNFGTGSLRYAGGIDCFVLKIDGGTGNPVWAQTYGGTGSDICQGMDIRNGEIFLTGSYQNTVAFGGSCPSIASAGSNDIFLAKLSAGGSPACSWIKSIGGPGYDIPADVAADAGGNAFVTGSFTGSVALTGGPTLTGAGGYDVFFAKYNATGGFSWANRYGDSTGDTALDLDLDGSGNVVVTGIFGGTISFGSNSNCGPMSNWAGSTPDTFLVKFDNSGSCQWSKSFGTSSTVDGAIQGPTIAVDSPGNIAMTGSMSAGVNFGGAFLTGIDDDVFVAKFASDGVHLWSKRFSAGGRDYGTGTAIDTSGDVLLVGVYNAQVNLGGSVLTSVSQGGTYDWSTLVGKFAP